MIKNLFFCTAILLFVGQQGLAQMNPQEMADYQTELMTKQLELNTEQQGQIAEINLKYAEKQVDLMNQEGSMFGKMGEMKQIGKDKKAEFAAVLSAEQMQKFEDDLEPEMRKEMRKKMRSRR